jgi:hypothetical protein
MGAVGTVFETKESSMNWLKRWLARAVVEGHEDSDRQDRVYATRASNKLSVRQDVESDDGLNITVRKAIGGRIVTFRHYDAKTDRHSHRLYIVPEELDFERELGKMITLESMRG